MSEAVIVAIITVAGAVAVQIIISLTTKADIKKGQAVFNAVVDEKFKNVEEKFKTIDNKLTIHNGYADKLPRIETKLESLEKGLDEVKAKLK